MSKEFQWTDELVIDLLMGKFVARSQCEVMIEQFKNDMRYSQEQERGWEIVELFHPVSKERITGESPFDKEMKYRVVIGVSSWVIHSVKRLSDDQIFSVGDKVVNRLATNLPHEGYAITALIVIEDRIQVCLRGGFFWLDDIEKAEKYSANPSQQKSKPVLFTTQDGVDCYGDENIWVVCIVDNTSYETYKPIPWKVGAGAVPGGFGVAFSKKEKAEHYIKENKPLNLSMKEIASCVTNYVYQGGSSRSVYERRRTEIDLDKLDALIKSKL